MEQNLEKRNQNEEVEYEEVEGYSNCSNVMKSCLYDCPPFWNAFITPNN